MGDVVSLIRLPKFLKTIIISKHLMYLIQLIKTLCYYFFDVCYSIKL